MTTTTPRWRVENWDYGREDDLDGRERQYRYDWHDKPWKMIADEPGDSKRFATWREAYAYARRQVEQARRDFLKQLLAEVSAMDDPIALSADPAGTTPVELARGHAQSTPAAGPVSERGASGAVRRLDGSVPADRLERCTRIDLGPMPTPEARPVKEVGWR